MDTILEEKNKIKQETISKIRRWTKGKEVTKDGLRAYLNKLEGKNGRLENRNKRTCWLGNNEVLKAIRKETWNTIKKKAI